jgi:hypothetical protein
MTVVIANDFGAFSGGASAVALRSALGLVARGHRIVYFTSVAPERDRLASAGIEVVECGEAGNLRHGPKAVLDRSGIPRPRGASRSFWIVCPHPARSSTFTGGTRRFPPASCLWPSRGICA